MNNATYFSSVGKMGLAKAFEAYVKRRGWRLEAMTWKDALHFAEANAMTTLEWNEGDVVQIAIPEHSLGGKYAVIDSFGDRALMTDASESEASRVYVRVAGEAADVGMDTNSLRKPDFPPGLVELVRSQMRACPVDLSKCPLKSEGACMGKGDE